MRLSNVQQKRPMQGCLSGTINQRGFHTEAYVTTSGECTLENSIENFLMKATVTTLLQVK